MGSKCFLSRAFLGITAGCLFYAFGHLSYACGAAIYAGDAVAQAPTLTMYAALQRIVIHSTQLQRDWAEIWVQEGLMVEAGLYPNPVLQLEAQNINGARDFRGLRRLELDAGIAQLIELGRKRAKRERAAAALRDVALWDAEIRLLDLRNQLYRAFAKIRLAQEKERLLNERLITTRKQAQQTLEQPRSSAEEQQHGKTQKQPRSDAKSLLQQRKAQAAIRLGELALKKGTLELTQARLELAQLWGSDCVDFETVDFELGSLIEPPPLCSLLPLLDTSPDLLRLQQISWAAKETLRLQKSLIFPDIASYAGTRYRRLDRCYTLTFSADIPLPLFDRNQGNIASAQAALTKALLDEELLLVQQRSTLTLAHYKWSLAYEQAATLQTYAQELEETLQLMQAHFAAGKLTYAEVIQAQTELLDTREQLFESLLETHLLRAEVERLIGQACVCRETFGSS